MGWEGVGPKMGLALAPVLAAAIALRLLSPEIAAIPGLPALARWVAGGVLLAIGVPFYVWTAVYFLRRFFGGGLLTEGPFAWCQNPIYGSFIVFFLPAAALLWNAWPLFVADVALYGIFRAFIRVEYRMLEDRFGDAYRTYRARVPEVLPLPPALRTAREQHA
jgi:protein-S-isoprenylcysteine O-methyltransferase Ste14